MNRKREIQISRPCIGEKELARVQEPLKRGWLTQGPEVAQFERTFAERHNVKYAIATTSCTTALHIILKALGIGPGDEVIVPAFTWIATANSVLYCGAEPVFVDIRRETFNIDPEKVRKRITANTKAIIVVHLFGLCADVDSISEVSKGIPIIEDAACASGSLYKERPAGSLGIAGAFSFHPRKVITTGEGGMITTNDDQLAEKANMLRNHGAVISEEIRHKGNQPYILPEFPVLGYNYRMTDLQGAIGLCQLEKLDQFIEERHHWAEFYSQELHNIPWLIPPQIPEGYRTNWQSYVCYMDTDSAPMGRDEFMSYLYKKGINTRPGTHCVPALKFYREKHRLDEEEYTISKECEKNTIALPIHNMMSEDDYHYVVETIKEVC